MTGQCALPVVSRRHGEAYREQVAEARAIERDFPGWHVWISDNGRWWAVRQGPKARNNRDDQRPMTIDADDPGGLRAQLAVYQEPRP